MTSITKNIALEGHHGRFETVQKKFAKLLGEACYCLYKLPGRGKIVATTLPHNNKLYRSMEDLLLYSI